MMHEKEMRQVYAELLVERAEKDDRIVVLEADLMKATGTTPFKEKFPERFVDVGVAEANMIGTAAGMAVMGKIPFAHSFTPFATRRVLDQIAISIAYAKVNAKIGGTDPGIMAELNGGTHMSVSDAGLIRGLPNMIVVEPADAIQLKSLFPQITDVENPVYMRLARKAKELYFEDETEFELGKIYQMKEGHDVTIICSGLMIKYSKMAVEILEKEGISVRLLNMHTLKPVDKEMIIKAAEETGAIVTAENHSIVNGWGTAVAEVVVENCPVPMERIGIRDHFGEVGLVPFLLEKYHMTEKDIVDAVKKVLKRK
ncbi:MAG TPA: transketolase C-terminal domain-containing protein [Thermotogota bacterium]|nr:transketolase C-terminal domain-containing protein [Thermotogota bacterium]HPJ87568.1 transketolase C-terminal domain-containing protein [Thermotogota bacterium]HPR94773.1 transketolase C-terminal domain-containing protein [Thermotogota bacterium]